MLKNMRMMLETAPSATYILPFPVSVNSAYVNTSSGRARSKAYNKWKVEAMAYLMTQRPTRLTGNIMVLLTLPIKDKKKRDCANYEKVVSDLLVYTGCLEDDSNIICNVQQWDVSLTNKDRCTVTIWQHIEE